MRKTDFETFIDKLHKQQNLAVLSANSKTARVQDNESKDIFMVYYVSNGSERRNEEFENVLSINAQVDQYSVFIFDTKRSVASYVENDWQDPQFRDGQNHADLSFGEEKASTKISSNSILLQQVYKGLLQYTQVTECDDADGDATLVRGIEKSLQLGNKNYSFVRVVGDYQSPALLLPTPLTKEGESIVAYMNTLAKQQASEYQLASEEFAANDSYKQTPSYQDLEKQRLDAFSNQDWSTFEKLSEELGFPPERVQGFGLDD